MKKEMLAYCAVVVLAGAGRCDQPGFESKAWRGETSYVRLPAGTVNGLVPFAGRDLDGVKLSLLRFENVKYDKTERTSEPVKDKNGNVVKEKNGKDKMRNYLKFIAKDSVPDVCKTWKPGDAQSPTMVKVSVATDAKPGARKFGPLELTVVDRVLPPAKDWKYFLDLWQHPWAVSRFFNVKPFSKEHYAKMEPIWRNLAECGCKALTVTLLDLPWNHQCYDGYHSMIRRVHLDSGFIVDFSLFDEYVEFGRKCGLGPDIACYTMCPWGYMATWEDKDGNIHREKMLPGTPEFEKYWGPFLAGFAKHLEEKGWFEDTYIAMDERAPKDVKLVCDLIQKYAPGMKVAMAGNKSPSEFDGITIDNYCQGLIHLRKHPKFFDELEPRRKQGHKTTFYVCASAMKPNTFMDSPFDEGYWLGAYPAITGFDGFLRWAANSWPEDPYKDATYRPKDWRAGDTFFIYPNGELSSRLIALRNGVVAAEKLRILKKAGVDVSKEVADIASKYDYKTAIYGKLDFPAFTRDMEAMVNR
ncbi:MAG: DUF4091 domain-containing protein [Kiritimatiellae bacterium]|nr:DUF4091 domain-containing protein [Kiritimatiellia bacterium]